MKCLKVPIKNAEKVKNKLQDCIDFDYVPAKDSEYIYFPLLKEIKTNGEIVEKKLKRRTKKTTLQEAFSFLSEEEQKKVVKSFDIVGSIAIIQIPESLIKKERKIGEGILKAVPAVKTVLKRSGNYKGEYRTIDLDYLAGEKTKETIATENGIKLKLDVEKVYYSIRSSNERLRVAKKVYGDVLVMFSGCAPFPLVIKKHGNVKRVVGIEKNIIAHKYAVENKVINKSNIELINDDVKVVKLKEKFDCVIMPLPKSAEDFLEDAIRFMNKGKIFLYLIRHENDLEQTKKDVIGKLSWMGKIAKIIDVKEAGDYAPGSHRYCMEIEIK